MTLCFDGREYERKDFIDQVTKALFGGHKGVRIEDVSEVLDIIAELEACIRASGRALRSISGR